MGTSKVADFLSGLGNLSRSTSSAYQLSGLVDLSFRESARYPCHALQTTRSFTEVSLYPRDTRRPIGSYRNTAVARHCSRDSGIVLLARDSLNYVLKPCV